MHTIEGYPFSIADLHTTPLGVERIRKNLSLNLDSSTDVVDFCRYLVLDDFAIFERKGKNWYVTSGGVRITVNANSNTIITAHKINK